jgi:hypothetical protein
MQFMLINPDGEELKAPSLEDVSQAVRGITEWGICELVSLDDDDSLICQLLLFVELPYGVIVRFCPEDGRDEFIFTAPSQEGVEDEQIETFDGGDVWIVPRSYFSTFDDCDAVVQYFLQTGTMLPARNWRALGLLADEG